MVENDQAEILRIVVTHMAGPNDNIRMEKQLEEHQALREQLERIWGVETTVIPVVTGHWGLEERQQIRSVQKRADLGRGT